MIASSRGSMQMPPAGSWSHLTLLISSEVDRCCCAGAVLTKMDGDSRGGAALSVKAVSGKPIKFVGTGEKLESLEVFYPDRIASRILGALQMMPASW